MSSQKYEDAWVTVPIRTVEATSRYRARIEAVKRMISCPPALDSGFWVVEDLQRPPHTIKAIEYLEDSA